MYQLYPLCQLWLQPESSECENRSLLPQRVLGGLLCSIPLPRLCWSKDIVPLQCISLCNTGLGFMDVCVWIIDHIYYLYGDNYINFRVTGVKHATFLRVCVHIHLYIYMTETRGKSPPVHLIDNRCKSPAKGVKGHCCHGNGVWVKARELGGWDGIGEGLGVRVQRSLLQLF